MSVFFGAVGDVLGLGLLVSAVVSAYIRRDKTSLTKPVSLFFIGVLILLFSVPGTSGNAGSSSTDSAAPQSASLTQGAPKTPSIKTSPNYDPAAIVAEAKKAYQKKDYQQTTDVLMNLRPVDLNRPEAHALWVKAKQHEANQLEAAESADRSDYADSYEDSLLGAGVDADVKAEGKDNTTLYIEMPTMSRPLVYQLTHPDAVANADLAQGHVWKSITDNRTDLLSYWKSMGFTRVIFTDGYEQTWKYDLTQW